MKRLLILALTLLLSLSLFACDGGGDPGGPMQDRYPESISTDVAELSLTVGQSTTLSVIMTDPNPDDMNSIFNSSLAVEGAEPYVSIERDMYMDFNGSTCEAHFTVTGLRAGTTTVRIFTPFSDASTTVDITVNPAAPVNNELVLGENTFDSSRNATFTYTAPSNGTLFLFGGDPLHGSLMYSYTVNGGEPMGLTPGAETDIPLIKGDVIEIVAEAYGGAEGNAILTAAWEYANGTGVGGAAGSIGLEYELSEDETYYILVGRGSCEDTNIVVPTEYKGLPVRAIADYAFYDKISDENLHNADTTVSISIPASVKEIGDYVFYYSSTLTSVVIEVEDGSFPTVGGSSFYFSQADSYSYRQLESLTFIGDFDAITASTPWPIAYTISGEPNVKTVTFNGNVGTFEAVYPCENLIVTGNVDTVKENSFGAGSYATYIKTVNFGSIRAIERRAFFGNTTTRSFNFNGLTTLGVSAFEESAITSAIIPGTLTEIPERAFYKSALGSLTLEDGVISIGTAAFMWCDLNRVNFGTTLRSIGTNAFNTSGIGGTLTIPANVTYIGDYAFSGNQGISSVVMTAPADGGIRVVSEGAFYGCDYMTSFSADGLTNYGAAVFENCTRLVRIDFGIINKINTSVLVGFWPYRAQVESITYDNTAENTDHFKYGNSTRPTLPSTVVDLIQLLGSDPSSAGVYERVAPTLE